MHANIFTPPDTANIREILINWLDHIEALPAAHLTAVKMDIELFSRIKGFIVWYRQGHLPKAHFFVHVSQAINCYNAIILKINTQS